MCAVIEKHYRVLSLLLILGGTIMYAVFSMNPLVWADEAYTFAMLRHSFSEIWAITAADVHPPLYYFLLKLLSAPFGCNLWAVRFFSALPCVLLLVTAAFQLPKLFGKRTAALFLLLCLLYPYTMTNAAETRMYSLAQLFVFLNALFACRCWQWNLGRDWAGFALSGVCAAYTHYFALVSAGMIYLITLLAATWKKRQLLKPWLLASMATILLYLPWLGCFLSQLAYKIENPYWIEPITLGTVVGYVRTILSANGIVLFPLFAGASFLAALLSMLASRDREGLRICLLALAVPLGTAAVGLAASILIRPVFVIRYLLPSLPLAVFAFARMLSRMKQEPLFAAVITVVLMGGASNAAYTAKHALIPSEDRISSALVDTLPEHDAWVVLSRYTNHPSQELAYYEPTVPIYTRDSLGPDNPYPNRIPLEEFQPEDSPEIILVLEKGVSFPEEFQSAYAAELLCTATVTGTPQYFWYLTALPG